MEVVVLKIYISRASNLYKEIRENDAGVASLLESNLKDIYLKINMLIKNRQLQFSRFKSLKSINLSHESESSRHAGVLHNNPRTFSLFDMNLGN